MLIGIIILTFLSILIVTYYILINFVLKKVKIDKRLESISNDMEYSAIDEKNKGSIYEKLLKKHIDKISNKITSFTSKKHLSSLETNLHLAGLHPKINKEKWMFYKVITSVVFNLLISIILTKLLELGSFIGTLLFVFLFLWINFVTYFILKRKISIRKKQIEKELPDTIDLITVSVEAGLSFDSAVSRFASSTNSHLAKEFKIMLKEIRLGIKKKEALKNVVKRCDVSDLSTFIGSIIQANELGVSITNILRIQSKIIREKRKQRAREKSMKAPIKLLFPT